MKRTMIHIDESKCDGCGLCIEGCPEGALQLVDGKAVLVGEILCDGLGACIAQCPQDAIHIEEREAEPYQESQVLENILEKGEAALLAHLKHLQHHNQHTYLTEALALLKQKNHAIPTAFDPNISSSHHTTQTKFQGCPGSQTINLKSKPTSNTTENPVYPSALQHWPIQLHLVSPHAPHYHSSDLLLTADCVAYSLGNFHNQYLTNHTLAVACPKLDQGLDRYQKKLVSFIEEAQINTLTVLIMEVPCCTGLVRLAEQAAKQANRKIPVKAIQVSVDGEILNEEWINL
jgi:NAD-dependent dihydropyrimidine dehydrogenase PreA subunit